MWRIAWWIILAVVILIVAANIINLIAYIFKEHRDRKKEEERLRRNAEIDEMKKNGKLKLDLWKPFSETLKEKYGETVDKKDTSWDDFAKYYIIWLCLFGLVAIITVVTALILKYK